MKHFVIMLLLLAVCGSTLVLVAASAGSPGQAQAQPSLVPWLPSHSYADGARPDARLDRPVQLWGAGTSLEEVFADLAEQTEVVLTFYPAADENRRVRVNVYLNQDAPPSLRDVLAQVMWTTDCAIASEETGDPSAPYRYYLLSTSIAATAGSRLAEDWQAAMDAMRDEWESRLPPREQIAAKLDEYRRALALSQDDLVATYYGIDDHLLATLLDPAGRASASFLTGLESDKLDTLLDGDPLLLNWNELTPAQRSDLQSCLRTPDWGGGPRGRRRASEVDWSETQPETITIGGVAWGRAAISAQQIQPAEGESSPGRGIRGRFLMSPMLNLTGEGDLLPDEDIAIRRALGESISEDQAGELRREWREARRDEGRQQWEDRVREAAEETVASETALSPSAEALLSSISLYLDAETPLALWQVQQAVASASGFSIVSDAFYQPSRSLTRARQVLYPSHEGDLSAFQILSLGALATEDVNRLAFSSVEDSSAGWAWEDAGAFLRFRSRARDLWRAAMVPEDTSAWLDAWLDPLLEGAAGSSIDITLDPQYMSILADSLTDIQLQHGGKIISGDPSEPATANRNAVRAGILSELFRHATTFRALSSLSKNQWDELRGTGLRVTYDLSEEQRVALGLAAPPEDLNADRAPGFRGFRGRSARPFGARRGRRFGGPGGPNGRGPGLPGDREMARAVVILEDERPEGPDSGRYSFERGLPSGDGQSPGGRGMWGRPTDSDYLTLRVDGEVRASYRLPHIITVQLNTPSE